MSPYEKQKNKTKQKCDWEAERDRTNVCLNKSFAVQSFNHYGAEKLEYRVLLIYASIDDNSMN